MNDEQQLLASAYLDGVLTAEERARAEADPEVMAAVERLGELRRALSVVGPPDPDRRDGAINAALDDFDAARRPTAPLAASARAGRRSSTWFLGAAAAALVLVVAGGILAMRNAQNSDDSAGGAAATEASGTTAVAAQAEADAGGGEESTARTEAAPRSGTDFAAGAAPTTTAAAGTLAAAASTTPAPQAERIPPVLTSPQDLTSFAATARQFSTDDSAIARLPCHRGQWQGPAFYVIDGVDTLVDVYLARAAHEVRAVDPTTCAILVTAPAP